MMSFSTWMIQEAVERDATNIPHVENLIIDKQINGAKEAASVLQRMYEHYTDTGEEHLPVHIKVDGAPSLIAGKDPEDDQFFMGMTKSILGSKEPKYVKSLKDIDTVYAGKDPDLLYTLKVAFSALHKLQWKHPLEGDVLFTPKLKKTANIKGTQYYTFKPNLIVYAVPEHSDMGGHVGPADFGIAFHTTLEGESIKDFTPHIGADITSLRAPRTVFVMSNAYKSIVGDTSISDTHASSINAALQKLQYKTVRLDDNAFLKALGANSTLRSNFTIFQNALIKDGRSIVMPVETMLKHFESFLQERQESTAQDMMQTLTGMRDDIQRVLDWQKLVVDIKLILLKVLNNPKQIAKHTLQPLYNLGQGLIHGAHEGYVTTDTNGNFVKLVDRIDYSKKNNEFGRFSKLKK